MFLKRLEKCFAASSPYFLLMLVLMLSGPLFAQDTDRTQIIDVGKAGYAVSAQTIIENISAQIPNFMQMVSAIAYVMGMYFVFLGIVKLRAYGESRTMMSQEHSLKGPLIFLTVGAFLIYLPTSVQVGMSTFWAEPTPYGYLREKDQWREFINDAFLIVQFVGIVAFIRGLVIMTHLAGHGGQPGTFARGMTHIIGGIFCVNIYQFTQVVMNLFGYNFA